MHIWTLHCFTSNKDYTDCFWKFGDSQTSRNYKSTLQINTPQVKCCLFLSWYFAVIFSLSPPPLPTFFSIYFPDVTYNRLHIKLVLRRIEPYTHIRPCIQALKILKKYLPSIFYFLKMTDNSFALYWFMLLWMVEVSPFLVTYLMPSLIFPFFS